MEVSLKCFDPCESLIGGIFCIMDNVVFSPEIPLLKMFFFSNKLNECKQIGLTRAYAID